MKQNVAVVRTLAVTLLAVGIGVPLLKAQALTEYSMGMSSSAGGAAGFGSTGFGSTIGSTFGKTGSTLSSSMSKAVNEISDRLKAPVRVSPEQVMQENRAAFASQAGEAGGKLRFASDPDDASVFVDGRLVARTPAEITLPKGKHAIKITRPDRDPWLQQATVAKGQNVEIRAKLVNPYPSVITLSFDDATK